MFARKSTIMLALGLLLLLGLLLALPRDTSEARGADRGEAAPAASVSDRPADQTAAARMIMQYSAKFVCLEPIQPGVYSYGSTVPLVKEATGVVIHNPNSFGVTLYKKAVRAPVENPNTIAQGVAPGKWVTVTLEPDYAFHIDCDDIAKLLTNNPAATFIGTFGVGVEVEGMVVVAIGPQINAAGTPVRYGPLDVTAEYVRGSEVMKKDIHYQPWWWWWWWPLPWRLGYAYERVIPVQTDPTLNLDCREILYNALHQDVGRVVVSPTLQALTNQALEVGRSLDPTNIGGVNDQTEPALVALIGGCRKIFNGATLNLDIDYVLMSNQTCTDADPRTPGVPGQCGAAPVTNIRYPWWPGRWYDLPVVHPQNVSTDLDKYFRTWHAQQWIAAGAPAPTVNAAMVYWFPYWCGWNYWWWWGNSGDCTDIAVGEGESLDVEQVTPTRVYVNVWPPQ
jgi:hypothetical protein